MKKALVLLLALSFVGGVFAQDLSFSGGVSSGFSIYAGKDRGANNNEVKGYDNNSGTESIDFDLNGKFDADTWGVQFGLTTEYSPGAVDKGVNIYDAHAWLKLLDGVIVLRGGLIDPDGYSAGGQYLDDPGLMGGGLFKVEVAPMDGLSIGVTFHWPSYGVRAYSTAFLTAWDDYWNAGTPDDTKKEDYEKELAKIGSAGNINSAESIADFFSSMAFGVAFSTDAFAIKVAARLYSRDDAYGMDGIPDPTKALVGFTATAPVQEMDMAMVAGVDVNVIDGLSIHLSSKIDYLLGKKDTAVGLGLDVGYKLGDAMSAGLGTYFHIEDGFKKMWFRPNFTYNLSDSMSVTIRVPLEVGNYNDDLKLSYWGIDLWLKYTMGKAYLQPRYNLRSYTKEGNSGKAGMDHMIGLYMGASF